MQQDDGGEGKLSEEGSDDVEELNEKEEDSEED